RLYKDGQDAPMSSFLSFPSWPLPELDLYSRYAMLGFQFVLFVAVTILGGVRSAPVTQDCKNCISITSTQTRGDGWLRAALKRIDDDLSRHSDYQLLQLESGEDQDKFS
ncbi:unnamed protein product, partial [Meganyctiphanes norvegica]